jgi:hypothetical protein
VSGADARHEIAGGRPGYRDVLAIVLDPIFLVR